MSQACGSRMQADAASSLPGLFVSRGFTRSAGEVKLGVEAVGIAAEIVRRRDGKDAPPA